jgi:hypothetical protein
MKRAYLVSISSLVVLYRLKFIKLFLYPDNILTFYELFKTMVHFKKMTASWRSESFSLSVMVKDLIGQSSG